jgi:electron transfer flavoprotein beta subunit
VDVLVCVKRVPMVGGRIVLQDDRRHIDTTLLGFTVSPHEECAVEEAVRLTETHGGSVTVLTLGPPEAAEQLRSAVAVGAGHAVLLGTDRDDFGPVATAKAIAAATKGLEGERERPFDLVMFGNEAADTGDYQVGVRVAHALGRPVATGIKRLDVEGGSAAARRTYRGTEELFTLVLPAVVTVKEGINLPRYPSLPGRMRAKKAEIRVLEPEHEPEGLEMQALRVPRVERRSAEVIGHGRDAVPALVELLARLGVIE